MSTFFEIVKSRRVNYFYEQNRPLSDESLWQILEAARWAPTGNNIRIHRYVCLTERKTIKQIKVLSPGFLATLPSALVIICINEAQSDVATFEPVYHKYIDVGTAAQNMLLTAHSLGIASGIVTSFAREAVQVICNIPDSWSPEMLILLGYRAKPPADAIQWPKSRVRIQDLVQWGVSPEAVSERKK